MPGDKTRFRALPECDSVKSCRVSDDLETRLGHPPQAAYFTGRPCFLRTGLRLTFVFAPSIVKGFAGDGARARLIERPESFAHDPSSLVLSRPLL